MVHFGYKQQVPGYCCKNCGEPIGYLGRFLDFVLDPISLHKCTFSNLRAIPMPEPKPPHGAKSGAVNHGPNVRHPDNERLLRVEQKLDALNANMRELIGMVAMMAGHQHGRRLAVRPNSLRAKIIKHVRDNGPQTFDQIKNAFPDYPPKSLASYVSEMKNVNNDLIQGGYGQPYTLHERHR